MQTAETKPKAKFVKGEWEARLRERAKVLYESVTQVGNVAEDAIEEIFVEFKDATLQSWKNGLSTGAWRVTHKGKREPSKEEPA